MKWLVSLFLVVALGDSLAAQDSVPPSHNSGGNRM